MRIRNLTLALLALALAAPVAAEERPVILFFGDSLTSGYGTSREVAYPAVVQTLIDSAGLKGTSIGSGVSGETSAAGLRRIDWVLGAQEAVDIFVLALGGNDGLRGVHLASTETNLQGILDRVKAKHPEAALVIAGVLIPPNLGTDYRETFAGIYPRLAEANGATLIPFLLEGVATIDSLNVDDIHPNERGHRIVGELVWSTLEPLVRDRQPGDGNTAD